MLARGNAEFTRRAALPLHHGLAALWKVLLDRLQVKKKTAAAATTTKLHSHSKDIPYLLNLWEVPFWLGEAKWKCRVGFGQNTREVFKYQLFCRMNQNYRPSIFFPTIVSSNSFLCFHFLYLQLLFLSFKQGVKHFFLFVWQRTWKWCHQYWPSCIGWVFFLYWPRFICTGGVFHVLVDFFQYIAWVGHPYDASQFCDIDAILM